MRRSRKPLMVQAIRGFESPPFRQYVSCAALDEISMSEANRCRLLVYKKTAAQSYALSGPLTLSGLQGFRRAHTIPDRDVALLDAAGLTAMDTAGALWLRELQESNPGLVVRNLSATHQALFDLIKQTDLGSQRQPRVPQSLLVRLIMRLGKGAVHAVDSGRCLLAFLGQVLVFWWQNLIRLDKFRWDSMARHIEETGLNAMPIVALVAFLISIVLAYQGVLQLKPLGAEIFTINLVAISVLREMGVLLTAIMVAGRSGSAFTAEIGVMKVNQEVDALSVIGVEPFNILVLPRLFALLITLPLLTFMANIVGLLGGSLACALLLDISWAQYWEQVRAVAKPTDLAVGLLKAPIFALIIAIVGCRLGMQVTGSAESVGASTTKAVVESIFLVLVADALFSVLFAELGW